MLHTATPHRIIINEAIELAKCFSEKDAYKFINGILDEAVRKSGKVIMVPDNIPETICAPAEK